MTKAKEIVLGWANGTEKIVNKNIVDVFGVGSGGADNSGPSVLVEVRDIPVYGKTDPDYYFDKLLLKKLLRWMYGASPRNNVLIFGDTGAGKSSIIEEMCARLGVPCYAFACSGKTRFQHFVGSRELVNGNSVWVDGPLVRAMREGGVFLMDEVTRLDPGEQMNMARVLDSNPKLAIPDTGEVVSAHPNFRVAATGNSAGFGDESGAYPGEKPSSIAFLDRFLKYHLAYMPEDVEVGLIKKKQPDLPDEIVTAMVKLGAEIRKNFVGAGGSLSVTLSPRSMFAWAAESIAYMRMGVKDHVWEALMDTSLNGAPTDNVNTIKEIFQNWMG